MLVISVGPIFLAPFGQALNTALKLDVAEPDVKLRSRPLLTYLFTLFPGDRPRQGKERQERKRKEKRRKKEGRKEGQKDEGFDA